MNVINFKTRAPIAEPAPTPTKDQQRITDYLTGCADRVLSEMEKVRAVCGLDGALKMLGDLADEMMQNQGKIL